MNIFLRPEVRADLEDATSWYDAQKRGLGGEFLDEVDAVFHRMEKHPLQFPKYHGDLLRRFPYSVYFLKERRRIVVVGILHQRRSPRSWQQRLRR